VRRTIAFGDVHGCATALSVLIREIRPEPDDLLIFLGDYVDGGPDTKGVLDQLVRLSARCQLVPLLGHHDEMLLNARRDPGELPKWLDRGGAATLQSYGSQATLDAVPQLHLAFLESCRPYFETSTHIFLHANYRPETPLDELDPETLRRTSLRHYLPAGRHCSGKTAVLGHTPQSRVLDLGYLMCLDTGCSDGGWLTACNVETRQIWQANE
jgi:serine/threonine protein phosphatase 1